jgi:ABC-type lipoprotein export system ATPase subunit
VLIGVNGSGKSNILNGILLLKKIALASHIPSNKEPVLSGCKLRTWFNLNGKALRYEALIKYATNERNIDEDVSATEEWNFKDITGRDKGVNIPLAIMRETERFSQQPARERGLWLPQIRWLPVDKKLDKQMKLLEPVFDFIKKISYYSASRFTDPSKCPASFELEGKRLSQSLPRHGEEHLQFMYDLYSAYKSKTNEFKEFLSLVGSDGISLVDDIKYDEIDVPPAIFKGVKGGRVVQRKVKRLLVIPNFIIQGTRLSPSQLSEGTFKTLAILFYIITDKSQLLLLEEPEACIHHGLLASIVEIIKDFSRKKQIIISTHSDFVLDALDPSNIFIVRNDPEKGTVVKHVPSAMSAREYKTLKEYLDNFGNLGEYWRHGELEG